MQTILRVTEISPRHYSSKSVIQLHPLLFIRIDAMQAKTETTWVASKPPVMAHSDHLTNMMMSRKNDSKRKNSTVRKPRVVLAVVMSQIRGVRIIGATVVPMLHTVAWYYLRHMIYGRENDHRPLLIRTASLLLPGDNCSHSSERTHSRMLTKNAIRLRIKSAQRM